MLPDANLHTSQRLQSTNHMENVLNWIFFWGGGEMARKTLGRNKQTHSQPVLDKLIGKVLRNHGPHPPSFIKPSSNSESMMR